MVGTIYVEDHQALLYTKYISCGPHGYRKDVFKLFSHYMSESYLSPGAWRVFIKGTHVRDH